MNRLLLVLLSLLLITPAWAQIAEIQVPSMADEEDIEQLKNEVEDLIALRLESKTPVLVNYRGGQATVIEADITEAGTQGVDLYEPNPAAGYWGDALTQMETNREKLQEELSWLIRDRELELANKDLADNQLEQEWELRIAHCRAQIKALDIAESQAEDMLMEMEDSLLMVDWAALDTDNGTVLAKN